MRGREWMGFLVWAALVTPAWMTLAPPELGGGVRLVVVARGESMVPSLPPGTLAVVSPAGNYAVGDIIAYRSRDMGRVLLHRIVRREGTRYIVKGDANRFVDPGRPSAREIIGRLRFSFPRVGTALGWVAEPRKAAALAGGATAALGLGVGPGRGSRRSPSSGRRRTR